MVSTIQRATIIKRNNGYFYCFMFCWYRYFCQYKYWMRRHGSATVCFPPYCSKQKAIIMRIYCCVACVAINVVHVDCVAKGMQQSALVSILCCIQIHVSLKSIYNALGSSCKLPYICPILTKFGLSWEISVKMPSTKFHEAVEVRAVVIHTNRRTRRS